MIKGNNTIIYIDDLIKICNRYNIDSVSQFIIYVDRVDKLELSNIKYDNITLYISEPIEIFDIKFDVYGKLDYLFFIQDENLDLRDIDKLDYFNRMKKLIKLRKYINEGMVTQFSTPKEVRIFVDNITLNDLSTFKLFDVINIEDNIIEKPNITIIGENIKIINKENFNIKVISNG